MAKESGFRIRVDEQLRKDFLEACRSKDMTASQVIRHFMKDYVAEELPSSVQNELFHDQEITIHEPHTSYSS